MSDTTDGKWVFSVDGEGMLHLKVPQGTNPQLEVPLWDLLRSDIGNDLNRLRDYREQLEKYGEATSNATTQDIDGDNVVMTALYDQWETVEMPKVQFYHFLDQYEAFLKSRQ